MSESESKTVCSIQKLREITERATLEKKNEKQAKILDSITKAIHHIMETEESSNKMEDAATKGRKSCIIYSYGFVKKDSNGHFEEVDVKGKKVKFGDNYLWFLMSQKMKMDPTYSVNM